MHATYTRMEYAKLSNVFAHHSCCHAIPCQSSDEPVRFLLFLSPQLGIGSSSNDSLNNGTIKTKL